MNHSFNHAGSGALRADSIDVTGTVTATSLVGALTGNSTGTHTGAVVTDDLTLDNVKLIAPPPNTQAELLAALGLTGVSAWRLDQVGVAGNVASFGDTATTLATAGTPTFGHALASATGAAARGMYFDAATLDACSAAVLAPGTTSLIAGARVALVGDPGGTTHFLFGCTKGTAGAPGWSIYVTDTGGIEYLIYDGTHSFTASMAAAVIPIGAAPIEIIAQIDWTGGSNPTFRARWSRNGVNLGSTSATLTALTTLTVAGQEFGFGAIPAAAPAFNGGAWVQWGWYASGAQTEGATKAQTCAQGLGWEQ
jgi:hypothetical protein